MVKISNKIKHPSNKFILGGNLKNDLEFVDPIHLRNKIHEQSHFSILYVVLLISSVLVCTLGLLMDSTAIVIGGMLIAPLMWPLARLGFGIAHRSPQHLYRGFLLVIVSILIGAASSYFITSISPIKVINDEILARTSPTLMDLFVALAAGLVAAIAITQKKIADSLAGVAIAVSLMPPLCTVGIALSLRNIDYSLGALLLFAVNAACITLVTTIVFVWTQYARKERVKIATRAAVANLLVVLILCVPLVQFLRSYSFEIKSYTIITNYMEDYIDLKDPTASFEKISIEQTDRETLSVSADLLLPTDAAFTFEDNDQLIKNLENLVSKKILLNLRIQSIFEPVSKNQSENEELIKLLNSRLSEELTKLDSSYIINSISSTSRDNGSWVISADVLTSPDAVPTANTVTDLSKLLSDEYKQNIDVNITFIPRLTLRSDKQNQLEEVQKTLESVTKSITSSSELSAVVLTEESESYRVAFTITTANVDLYDDEFLNLLKTTLENQLNSGVNLRVRLVPAVDIEA